MIVFVHVLLFASLSLRHHVIASLHFFILLSHTFHPQTLHPQTDEILSLPQVRMDRAECPSEIVPFLVRKIEDVAVERHVEEEQSQQDGADDLGDVEIGAAPQPAVVAARRVGAAATTAAAVAARTRAVVAAAEAAPALAAALLSRGPRHAAHLPAAGPTAPAVLARVFPHKGGGEALAGVGGRDEGQLEAERGAGGGVGRGCGGVDGRGGPPGRGRERGAVSPGGEGAEALTVGG